MPAKVPVEIIEVAKNEMLIAMLPDGEEQPIILEHDLDRKRPIFMNSEVEFKIIRFLTVEKP